MSIPESVVHDFSLDAKNMTRSAINFIRAALGIGGIAALVLGILLLVWPIHTLAVFTVFLGIYFLITGVVRLAIGIFSSGTSAGMRTLNIILGLLLVIIGIISLRNLQSATTVLLIFIVALVGVGWIIEGVLALVESRNSSSKGWAIFFGIISIIAGIVFLSLPLTSALVLIIFAAIALIVLGIVGIIRAFTFGRSVLKATSA